MKKIIKRSLLLLLYLLVLTGCGGSRRESQTPNETVLMENEENNSNVNLYLSMATNGDWSASCKGEVIENELEALEQRTEGKIQIRLYDRSRLGDDAHLVSGVQAGTIDIVQSSPAMQINAVPQAALFDIPGLLNSLDAWNALLEGEYRQVMEKYYEDAGLVLLDVFAYSWRNLSSREPVQKPSDLEGVRIRTLENKYQEAYWNSLGATAVPYRFAELYFCLHEGMADAQENLLDVMLADNLFEVQGCVTLTHHLPMISAIAMNRDKYESLSEEEQGELALFTQGLKENLIREMPEDEERILETLDHDYNIEIFEPSPELQQKLADGKETVLQMLRQELGDETVEAFLSAASAVKNS